MKTIFSLAIYLIGFISIFARADSIYVGAWSMHFKDHYQKTETEVVDACVYGPCQSRTMISYRKTDLNNSNNLIAYEKNGYIVGHMYNSFNRSTVVAFKQFTISHYGKFQLMIDVGATYGYRSCSYDDDGLKTKACPLAAFEMQYTKYSIRPTVFVTVKTVSIAANFKF